MNKEQCRIIESYARYRKNWKISNTGEGHSILEETGRGEWQKVSKDTPMYAIYCITYIVGLHGKKYYIDSFSSNK